MNEIQSEESRIKGNIARAKELMGCLWAEIESVLAAGGEGEIEGSFPLFALVDGEACKPSGDRTYVIRLKAKA